MNNLIQEIEKSELKESLDKLGAKKIPRIKSGDIVRLTQVFIEKDKERHSVFEGMVIKVSHGSNTRRTITIRRVIDNVGVEKIVPLYLSNISRIQVLKSSKTRRAKLYYLRNLSGKKARLKEKGLDKEVIEMAALDEKKAQEGAKDKKVEKAKKAAKNKNKDDKTEEKTGK